MKKLAFILLFWCATAFGSQDSTFAVWGPVNLIGTTPVQVLTTNGQSPTSYRIRCLVTGYFSWSPNSSVIIPVAPTAGVPSQFTEGMTAGTVETFALPPNAFFLSNNAAGFEISPGEGM